MRILGKGSADVAHHLARKPGALAFGKVREHRPDVGPQVSCIWEVIDEMRSNETTQGGGPAERHHFEQCPEWQHEGGVEGVSDAQIPRIRAI